MKTTPSDNPAAAAATVVHEVLKPKKKKENKKLGGPHFSLFFVCSVHHFHHSLQKNGLMWVVQALFFGFAERLFEDFIFYFSHLSESGISFSFLGFLQSTEKKQFEEAQKAKSLSTFSSSSLRFTFIFVFFFQVSSWFFSFLGFVYSICLIDPKIFYVWMGMTAFFF